MWTYSTRTVLTWYLAARMRVCLNLSNAVAVGAYEALRQWDFADLETHGQLTRYEWSEDVK